MTMCCHVLNRALIKIPHNNKHNDDGGHVGHGGHGGHSAVKAMSSVSVLSVKLISVHEWYMKVVFCCTV